MLQKYKKYRTACPGTVVKVKALRGKREESPLTMREGQAGL